MERDIYLRYRRNITEARGKRLETLGLENSSCQTNISYSRCYAINKVLRCPVSEFEKFYYESDPRYFGYGARLTAPEFYERIMRQLKKEVRMDHHEQIVEEAREMRRIRKAKERAKISLTVN